MGGVKPEDEPPLIYQAVKTYVDDSGEPQIEYEIRAQYVGSDDTSGPMLLLHQHDAHRKDMIAVDLAVLKDIVARAELRQGGAK